MRKILFRQLKQLVTITPILFFSTLQYVASAEIVSVGLTSVQPPLVIDTRTKKGLVYDVLDILNNFQDDFKFVGNFYPPKRLLAEYDTLGIHMIAFNDVKWGWAQRKGVGSLTLTDGRDLFFSLKKGIKRTPKGGLTAVSGFHYAFAGFDPVTLQNMPNVSLVIDEPAVIKMLVNGRTEKGISSETYLKWLSVSDPGTFSMLQIEEKEDNRYNRQLVVFPSSPISIDQLNVFLNNANVRTALAKAFKKYGLSPPPLK